MQKQARHIFLVGAKSLGAYGGYETFIDKLTEYHQTDLRLQYHVACKANGEGHMDETKLDGVSNVITDKKGRTIRFQYHNSDCFMLRVPSIGPAQAIYYDCKALSEVCKYVKKKQISDYIVYIMACRIGPFMSHYVRKIHKSGGKVYLNPDGHEWMRAKWSPMIRKYWKWSEKLMVRHSDLMICDSKNIEKYLQESYRKFAPDTTYIAYGAEFRPSAVPEEQYRNWLSEKGLKDGEYYLIVGRFVPENNYETMIREFMRSHTDKSLAIVTNADDAFLNKLNSQLAFREDARIKFVGTVYDKELLMKIRERAYAYLHGHEVGGTNPSLIEALGSTKVNLLLKVGFNEEVGLDAALYWTKQDGDLAALIEKAEQLPEQERAILGEKAKERVKTAYSWRFIADRYAEEFLK